MEKQEGITVKKSADFSEWYTQLLQKAELADVRYNVKGLPVYREWAVMSMKKIYAKFEKALESKGHFPIILPALIPESNFKLEESHVQGFTPQVFWVTEHGDKEPIEEKLALRPTSETAFYQMYALWIRSYNDLPFKRYQSCPVWRFEGKATRPFFRTREIHWIEAHDAFATEAEAKRQVLEDMETTKEVLLDELAMPFIFFERPDWDKFAGAVHTYAADALMPSGKVVQLPSTHLLGQNFSKPFNVKYVDKDGKENYVYITCYGPAISRIYGSLIALHGDDKGLILPFDIAPLQIVIVPVIFEQDKESVVKKCKEIEKKLKDYIVKLDDRENTAGWKFNEWEMKGVPIRIEIGPKDIKEKSITIFRRDLNKKYAVKETELLTEIEKIKKEFTLNLKKKAEEQFKDNIIEAKTASEIKRILDSDKIAKVNFCSLEKSGEKCAEFVEKELGGFVRGKRVDEKESAKGNCIICGKKSNIITYIARSY